MNSLATFAAATTALLALSATGARAYTPEKPPPANTKWVFGDCIFPNPTPYESPWDACDRIFGNFYAGPDYTIEWQGSKPDGSKCPSGTNALWCPTNLQTDGPGYPAPDNAVWAWGACVARYRPQPTPEEICRSMYGDKFTGITGSSGYGQMPTGGNCKFESDAWCAVKKPSDGGERVWCVPDCATGESLLVTKLPDGRNTCKGPRSNQCSWYKDTQCKELKSDSGPPLTVGDIIACPEYPVAGSASKWCLDAHRYIDNNEGIPVCNEPVPPSTCKATTGGPQYGGSKWICLADGNGSGNYVPVKLTANDNAACYSTNSADCVWTSKDCCEAIAASADGSTPYFECGPPHYAVWGITGYEDENGWCKGALKALYGQKPEVIPTVPVPANRTVTSCLKEVASGSCVYTTSQQTPDWLGFAACGGAGRETAYIHYYQTTRQCPANEMEVVGRCLVMDQPSDCGAAARATSIGYVRAKAGDGFCTSGGSRQALLMDTCKNTCGNDLRDGRGIYSFSCMNGDQLYCICASYV